MSAARELALALPEAEEQPHHEISSFRVRGRIFATVPDEAHLRVMTGERDIRAAVAEHPAACQEFWWGSRLACVVVDLSAVAPFLLSELLVEAWMLKAPKRLVREYEAGL